MGGKRSIAVRGSVVLIVVLLAVLVWRNNTRVPADAPAPEPDRAEADPEFPILLSEVEPGSEAPGAGKAEPSSGSAEEQPRARRTITVLGPGGAPLEGVALRYSKYWPKAVLTGPDGRAEFPGNLPEGDLDIGVLSGAIYRVHRLRAGESVLSFPDLLPLTVEVRDGVTGRMLWDAGLTLVREKIHKSKLEWKDDLLTLDPSPVERGKNVSLRFEVELPDGYRLLEGDSWRLSGTVGRFTDRVHVTVVAWPTISVRVRAEEHDGRPADGAGVTLFAPRPTTGRTVVKGFTTGPGGEIVVHDVPFVPGERVYAFVYSGNRGARSDPWTLRGAAREILVWARLPRHENLKLVTTRVKGGYSGSVGRAVGSRIGYRSLLSPFRVSVQVRVLRRDGAPAAKVLVRATGKGSNNATKRTNDGGIATFVFSSTGQVRCQVEEPGFLTGFPADLTIDEDMNGKTVKLELREGEGAHADIQVLDHEGYSVPWASISVSPTGKTPWIHVVDGTQRLNLYTDLNGWVHLPGLPAGEVKVRATYGTRSAVAKTAGGAVEIRLPPPK